MLEWLRLSEILKGGGFALHRYVGRLLKVGFLGQCIAIVAFTITCILIASTIDRTWILPGRDIGLLEHPAIWAFFAAQVALPLAMRQSLRKLMRARGQIRRVLAPEGRFSDAIVSPITQFVQLETMSSKAAATLFYLSGLAAFVWNTYQNQLPGTLLPFDFWDSINHPWGFWVSRAYKLYMFAWFFPYVALIHAAILVTILRMVREARIGGSLHLLPFDPDGVGGLGFVPPLITTPIAVALAIMAIPLAGALEVHRSLDVTPLIGLAFMIASAGFAYVVPILSLRTDVMALKKQMVRKLRELQQGHYARVMEEPSLSFQSLKESAEAMEYFEKLCVKVQAISNYPHLQRVLQYMGLALTPSVVSLVTKALETWNRSATGQ